MPCNSCTVGSIPTGLRVSGACSSAAWTEPTSAWNHSTSSATLDEQTFRYNDRKEMDDFDRFKLAMSQTGERLTFDRLTGKEPDTQKMR